MRTLLGALTQKNPFLLTTQSVAELFAQIGGSGRPGAQLRVFVVDAKGAKAVRKLQVGEDVHGICLQNFSLMCIARWRTIHA